jgi:hypothetical protein
MQPAGEGAYSGLPDFEYGIADLVTAIDLWLDPATGLPLQAAYRMDCPDIQEGTTRTGASQTCWVPVEGGSWTYEGESDDEGFAALTEPYAWLTLEEATALGLFTVPDGYTEIPADQGALYIPGSETWDDTPG